VETISRGLLVVALLALWVASAQARGGSSSVGQSNPGTVDINRTIDPQALVSQVGATPAMASSTGSAPGDLLRPNAGANGLSLAATTSGAIPMSNAGTAVPGAVGRDMDECCLGHEGPHNEGTLAPDMCRDAGRASNLRSPEAQSTPVRISICR
jgi:hypothetical protein